jgi:hypothetical protein
MTGRCLSRVFNKAANRLKSAVEKLISMWLSDMYLSDFAVSLPLSFLVSMLNEVTSFPLAI